MADGTSRVFGGRKEPTVVVGPDRLNQFRSQSRNRDRMGCSVLGLRPVDDPFCCVPIVSMQAGNLLYALPSQHEDANCPGVRRMDRSIWALEPSIEA